MATIGCVALVGGFSYTLCCAFTAVSEGIKSEDLCVCCCTGLCWPCYWGTAIAQTCEWCCFAEEGCYVGCCATQAVSDDDAPGKEEMDTGSCSEDEYEEEE